MKKYTYRHNLWSMTDAAIEVADQILTDAWARVYFLGLYAVEQVLLNFRMPVSQERFLREEDKLYGQG